jgi:hypothetical protein
MGGLAPEAVRAADRPVFPPSRDVAVTYRLSGQAEAGGTDPVTLDYSAGLQKLRADLGASRDVIVDLRDKSLAVLLPQQHLAIKTGAGREIDRLMTLPDTAAMHRAGADRVAGYACTIWRVTTKDLNGTLCITDDGVPLRGHGTDAKNRSSGFEATQVVYGPQPADLFEVPAGLRQMDMTALAGLGRPKP